MSKLTKEQAESFAPDSGTLSRGRKIAKPSAYRDIGADDRAIWGTALGSSTYLSMVDLHGPAFKCSCPVKKLPCKHIMGLMLLVADDESVIESEQQPEELQQWLSKRETAAVAKQNRKTGEVKDPEAQAKRAAKRESNIDAGVEALSLFLEDVLTVGLADAGKRARDVWDNVQRRLVDAQAGGLANRVENLRELVAQGAGSTEETLAAMSQLNLLCRSWTNRHALPAEQQAHLCQLVGWKQNQTPVQADSCEEWIVLSNGRRYEYDLYSQSVWMLESGGTRFARLLHFAKASIGASLPGGYASGCCLQGTLTFHSTWNPIRADFEGRNLLATPIKADPEPIKAVASTSLVTALTDLQQQRTAFPFNDAWPLLVANLRLVSHSGQLALADEDNVVMLLDEEFRARHRLMQLAGPLKFTLFMTTHDGHRLLPLAGLFEGIWHNLALDETGD